MKHLISLTIILVFSLSFLFSGVVPESARVADGLIAEAIFEIGLTIAIISFQNQMYHLPVEFRLLAKRTVTFLLKSYSL